MSRILKLSQFPYIFILFVCSFELYANDSFSGTIMLPNGSAKIQNSYELEFVAYGLLRTVKSRQIKTVFISKGSSSTNFSFSSIGRQNVAISGFSLAIICRTCEEYVSRQQFWTTEGTKFLSTDNIISPRSGFPQNINYTLISGTSISGVVHLGGGEPAARDIKLRVSAIENGPPNDDSFTSGGTVSVTIPRGSNSADFSVKGIRPAGFALNLQYVCENCLTDYRSFGNSLKTLSPRENHFNEDLTLLNTGLAISGIITIPKTLKDITNGRIELKYEFEDFDNFFDPLTTLVQTVSFDKAPVKIKYGILVPNNKWENLEIGYECRDFTNDLCKKVIAKGFFDESSSPFRVNEDRARGIFIDPFEVQFNRTNENLDFCIAPDEDSNGIADSSRAACSIFTIAPILLLLDD